MASRNPSGRWKSAGATPSSSRCKGRLYVRDLDVSAVNRRWKTCKTSTRSRRCRLVIIWRPVLSWRPMIYRFRTGIWNGSKAISFTPTCQFFGPQRPLNGPMIRSKMARIVHGQNFLDTNALMVCQVSGNSPRLWDETMLSAGRIYADAGQVTLFSPFVLACANAPADVAGTLAQLNAEALAGIAYIQLYKPGTRSIYGQFTVSTSMKTGAPMAGTPEIALIISASANWPAVTACRGARPARRPAPKCSTPNRATNPPPA